MTHLLIPESLVKEIVQKTLGFTRNGAYNHIDLFWAITKNKYFTDLPLFSKAIPEEQLKLLAESFRGRKLNRGNIRIAYFE